MMFPDRPKEIHPDWLIQVLIDRCRDDYIVDNEDLSLILTLNLGRKTPAAIPFFGWWDYGESILELGMVVAARGGVLTVPNLENYDQTEDLNAPADWLERWSNDDNLPDRYDLWAWFDMSSAQTPDGGPYFIGGPPTLEASEASFKRRYQILQERRAYRDSTRSRKT